MTAKELKRLRRTDLMEMLLELSKENLELRQQLEEANAKLADRELQVERAGSLAEAALQLSGIFEAAQKACDLYEHNFRLQCQKTQGQMEQGSGETGNEAPKKRRGKRRGKK